MPKPAKLPRWADDGAADIVEPNSGKKDIGWVGGERPPAQFFNWLLNLIYQWLLFSVEHTVHVPAVIGPLTAGTWAIDANLHPNTTLQADQQLFHPLIEVVETKISSLSIRTEWEPDIGGATAIARIVRVQDATTEVVAGTTITIDDNNGTATTDTLAFTAITIEAGWNYFITAELDGGSGGTPSFTVHWWEYDTSQ